MFPCEVIRLPARWTGAAALLLLALTAHGQQTIQFSKPAEDDPAGKANAFLPEKSAHDPSSFNAPKPLFQLRAPNGPDGMPVVPPPAYNYSPAVMAQWQKMLDERKNWTMLTPSEILGIPTPEKILGIADRDEDPKLTVQERFMKRQDIQSQTAASNAWRVAEMVLRQNGPFDLSQSVFNPLGDGSSNDKFREKGKKSDDGTQARPGLFTPIFGQRPDLLSDQDHSIPKPMSAWVSPFRSPELPPKQTPEQLAGMEKFRALLAGPAPEKPPEAPGFSSFASPAPAFAPGASMAASAFGSGGSPFKPLGGDMAKPTGVAPLPGITGPVMAPAAPAKTSAFTQPPPWSQNSSSSQQGPFAQRQF